MRSVSNLIIEENVVFEKTYHCGTITYSIVSIKWFKSVNMLFGIHGSMNDFNDIYNR